MPTRRGSISRGRARVLAVLDGSRGVRGQSERRTDTTARVCYLHPMLPEAQLALLVAALDRFAGLDALWLFGSEAAGRATSRSDVDLAALFATRPSPEALLAAREELREVVGRAVDLVDLERASPIVAMQALKHGRLVADRNVRHRVRFTAALPGRYEDVAILRRPGERLLLARLARGRA